MPIVTATIYNFLCEVTGLVLAAHVQQFATEHGRDFCVARKTDSSGDSYVIGLTSPYKYGQIAVIPSLEDPWLRADQQYKLLKVVTCEWNGAFDSRASIGMYMGSVSQLAEYLYGKFGLRGDEVQPRYRKVAFCDAPSFDPDIYLF